jgi:hypothetical protein
MIQQKKMDVFEQKGELGHNSSRSRQLKAPTEQQCTRNVCSFGMETAETKGLVAYDPEPMPASPDADKQSRQASSLGH